MNTKKKLEHRKCLIKCAEDLVDYWLDKEGATDPERMRRYAEQGCQIDIMRRGAVIWKVLRNPFEPDRYFLNLDRSEYGYEWRNFISSTYQLFGCNLAAAVNALDSIPGCPSHLATAKEYFEMRVAHVLGEHRRCVGARSRCIGSSLTTAGGAA